MAMLCSPEPATCYLYSNRDFEDMIKLRTWDGGIILDYPRGPSPITCPLTDLSFTTLQPPLPSVQSLIMPSSFLPQGLWTHCFLFGLLHLSFIKYFFISAKFNKYQLINWISQIKQIIIIDIYWAPLAWQDRYMKQKSCNTVWVLNCCQLILDS